MDIQWLNIHWNFEILHETPPSKKEEPHWLFSVKISLCLRSASTQRLMGFRVAFKICQGSD